MESKAPTNRFQRTTLRNAEGQPIGRPWKLDAAGNRVPIPEPRRPMPRALIHVPGATFPIDVLDVIITDYQAARIPGTTAEEVQPLKLNEGQIDEQLRRLEAWYAGKK